MYNVYPLTIVADRYNGAYSGGKFTAWNIDSDDTPYQIHSDDITCSNFWGNEGKHEKFTIGKGGSIEEAYQDLKIKLEQPNDT